MPSRILPTSLLAVAIALLTSGFARAEENWTPLFNGKDLSNWVNVNCAPETWSVGDGVIRCTGQPTGALRTKRMYENFIVELEWRHLKAGGNAGIFVWSSPIAAPGVPFLRSVEVQVLDNGYDAKGKNEWYTTHGDVFPIHGSTMKPIHKGNGMRCFPLEEHSRSAPEWNHYRIEAKDGKIRLSVNGHLVTGGDDCVWRKGYFGLESEGSPTEWRNLRIQELPASANAPTAEQTAPEDQNWRSLYTGTDLRGWGVTDANRKEFTSGDWQILAKGGGTLPCELPAPGTNFELIVDSRSDDESAPLAIELLRGETRHAIPLAGPKGKWIRHTIRVAGSTVTTSAPGNAPRTEENVLPRQGKDEKPLSFALKSAAAGGAFANLYIRSLPE